ncbi:hypothetical protein GCM10010330_16100 [Streptomyces tendae]|uniref:hypothetical protein n=1 Tax=Streptomyces tendae TaxID=1932 RepID=UPI001671B388|nr:hypothetical protein [Streptomyces tendae]GHA64057.1 hypothetical protein GCM10010330_16100 [Streptomyces tendae]
MVKITEVQVRQAEAAAAEQERVRSEASAVLEANPYSEMAALQLTEESRLAAQLRANAREIRAAFEAQATEEQRRASRPELEKAAAAEMKTARSEMPALEKQLVDALKTAQEGLVGVVSAAEAYTAAVGRHADVLVEAGLNFREGETGGERDVLGGARLKADGREYVPVASGALMSWLVLRVIEARVSQYHHLNGALSGTARAAGQQVPRVVEAVSAPKRVKRPEAPVPRVGAAPTLMDR